MSDIDNRLATDKTLKSVVEGLNKVAEEISKQSGRANIFGFRRFRGESNPNTRIEYLGDNKYFVPFTYDFANEVEHLNSWEDFIREVCRPVMLNFDGSVAYELNRDDTTKKVDGTASDISNSAFNGNAMVEFRKYRYVSRLTIGEYDYVYFSNVKINDTYEDSAFEDDGIKKDKFYFSMFEGSWDGTRMRSIADVAPMVSQNARTETDRAKANGTGWNIGAWNQLNYIWDLLTLIGKSDDLQGTFGQGWSTMSSAGTVGGSKAKGAFFGESSGKNVVRTLYIEDLWGRIWDRYNGLILDNNVFKVKKTGPYPTPSDASADYVDYVAHGTAPNEGYVKYASCDEYGFLPSEVGASATTYFCDYFYKNASGVRFALVGAHWNSAGECGRCVFVYGAWSYSTVSVGSRLLLI